MASIDPLERPRMDGHINLAVQLVISQMGIAMKLGVIHQLAGLDWLQRVIDDMELWPETRQAASALRSQLIGEVETLLSNYHQQRLRPSGQSDQPM